MPAQRRRVGGRPPCTRPDRGEAAVGPTHRPTAPPSPAIVRSDQVDRDRTDAPRAGLLGGTHHRVRLQLGDSPDQAVARVVAERVERPANPGHPLQPFGCLPEPPGEAGGLRGGPYRGVGAVHPTTMAFVPFVGGCEPGGGGDEGDGAGCVHGPPPLLGTLDEHEDHGRGGGAGNSAAGGLLPVVTGNAPQWPQSWPAVEHGAVTTLNVSAGRRDRHERIRTKSVTTRGNMTNSPGNAAGLLVRSRPRSLDLLGSLAFCEPTPGVAVRRHRRRTKPGRP